MSVDVKRDPSDARLDIVFVHGLKTDQKPWTNEESVFWPEKLLSAVIPNARILIFDYEEATVDNFWNEEDLISDISDELLGELMDQRRGEKAERPIIFIAHCLGGLVCENALIRAASHEKKKQLAESTIGLLLLGTPHFQPSTLSEATKYFQLAQQEAPPTSELQLLSQHILKIPQQFAQFRQAVPVKMECYYEGSPTKVKEQDVKIVDQAVAKPLDDAPLSRLAGNHHRMSRFGSDKDKDFKKVCRVLQDWVADLPEPEEEGTVNNISHASFAGSTNSGVQLGQNAGTLSGFSFGR